MVATTVTSLTIHCQMIYTCCDAHKEQGGSDVSIGCVLKEILCIDFPSLKSPAMVGNVGLCSLFDAFRLPSGCQLLFGTILVE